MERGKGGQRKQKWTSGVFARPLCPLLADHFANDPRTRLRWQMGKSKDEEEMV